MGASDHKVAFAIVCRGACTCAAAGSSSPSPPAVLNCRLSDLSVGVIHCRLEFSGGADEGDNIEIAHGARDVGYRDLKGENSVRWRQLG